MDTQPDPEYDRYILAQTKRLKLRQTRLNAISNYSRAQDIISEKVSKVSVIQKFISKLKTENRSLEQLMVELDTLNVSRFLEQIVAIIASTCTEREVDQLAELACRIAVLYQNFSTVMVKQLKKQLEAALTQEVKPQLLPLFHLTLELFVYGFPLPQNDIPDLIKKVFKAGIVAKEMGFMQLDHDKKEKMYAFNIDLYWVFFKEFGEVFCGLTSKLSERWAKQGRQLVKYPEMVSVQVKKSIVGFLDKYIKQVSVVLEQSYRAMQKMQTTLRNQLRLQGSFNPQTQKQYKAFTERYVKTKCKLLEIADMVSVSVQYQGSDQPVLQPHEITKQEFSIAQSGQIFQDQYQKELYINLPALPEQVVKSENEDKQYEQFRPKLDSCKNVQDADSLLKQFLSFNTKKTRRMLVKDLIQYRKEYQLVTPYLCRIAATLSKKWKDVGETINDLLFGEYERLKQSANTNFVTVDKRTRNLKYICQLTKFQLVDPDRTIACIKTLIDGLIGPNIDLLLVCLESVGRYLYLTKSSTSKFVFLLTQLKNVINKKSLPLMVQSQLNNSIALLKPTQPPAKKPKRPKSELEEEMKLLFRHLSKDNFNQAVASFSKMISNGAKGEEGQTPSEVFVRRLLKKVPKHEYIQNYLIALLLQKLESKELSARVKQQVQDRILRSISAEESQECLTWSRFFGQLFNYGIASREQFYGFMEDLLKMQLNPTGIINCICTILDSSKAYLNVKKTSSINQKLKFLMNFKNYINTRNYIPMFMEFEILDLLEEVQPEIVRLSNIEIVKFHSHIKEKRNNRDKDLNELKELEDFLKIKKKVQYKQKIEEEEFDRGQESQDLGAQIQGSQPSSKNNHGGQFQEYMKEEIEKSKGRIAKAKIAEELQTKKKKGTEKGVVILGRHGDRAMRKDVNIKL